MTISNLQLLQYARDGLITNIGINSGNPDAAEDLVEWRSHLDEVERRISLARARQSYLNKEHPRVAKR